jgi:hypothetical protein
MLNRTFGPKREEVTGNWRKFYRDCNCNRGPILLEWSAKGGCDGRIFNISSSFFTSCHSACELKCVIKQMPRQFPFHVPHSFKVLSIPFQCYKLSTKFLSPLSAFNIEFQISYTRRCITTPNIIRIVESKNMGWTVKVACVFRKINVW